jgi:peroxiredoxin
MKRLALVAAAVSAALLLAGCTTNDGLAAEYAEGSTKNYISGDGNIEVFEGDARGAAVSYTSETTSGDPIDSADFLGSVTVLNFWYASCAPCRVEAPILAGLNDEYSTEGVNFLGVNVRDQAVTAENFEKETGITYPSAIDTNDGNILFAFAATNTVSANAVPTTLVIDREGRVAARILGQIETERTLGTILDSVLAEDADEGN